VRRGQKAAGLLKKEMAELPKDKHFGGLGFLFGWSSSETYHDTRLKLFNFSLCAMLFALCFF
jgi:hypothetical protein